MTRVVEGLEVLPAHPRVYPRTQWIVPAGAFPAAAGPHLWLIYTRLENNLKSNLQTLLNIYTIDAPLFHENWSDFEVNVSRLMSFHFRLEVMCEEGVKLYGCQFLAKTVAIRPTIWWQTVRGVTPPMIRHQSECLGHLVPTSERDEEVRKANDTTLPQRLRDQ